MAALLGTPFLGGMAWIWLTTTDLARIEAGQCFANWDDFTNTADDGRLIYDRVRNADCDEPHAVQAFLVTDGFKVCANEFDDLVVAPRGVALESIQLNTDGRIDGTVSHTVCLAGHRDRTSLITGSVLRPDP